MHGCCSTARLGVPNMAFFFSRWNLSEDQLPAPLPRPYCAREAPAAMLAGPMEPWLGPYMEPWLDHYTEAEIALLEEMLGDRSAALWPQVQEQAARTCHTPLSEPPGSSRPQDCSPIAGPLSERPSRLERYAKGSVPAGGECIECFCYCSWLAFTLCAAATG